MKVDATIIYTLLASAATASTLNSRESEDAEAELIRRDESLEILTPTEEKSLWKRKGGGGARGGGGGGSSGRGGGGGGGSGGGSRNVGGANGGRTQSGSGPQPGFNTAGGPRYGGGAVAPYRSGNSSPGRNIAPFAIGGAALAFWPGYWAGNRMHAYRHNDDYTFFNATKNETQTKPVMCGCGDETPCSCDEPDDKDERDEILDELIGNGSYAALDKEVVTVADYDGESTILVNGTLPDGTTLRDPDADSATSLRNMGWYSLAGAAAAAAFIL